MALCLFQMDTRPPSSELGDVTKEIKKEYFKP